jgi:glycosyltransferase involved in cell wall biosynthesis
LAKVCFIGGTRYSRPLDPTSEKKFRALKVLGELFIIGFSQDLRPRRFTEHARFYLLPKLSVSVLRYAEMLAMGTPLVLWLILRHGIRVLVAQSPYEGVTAAIAKKITGWLGYKVVVVVENHGDFEESLFLQRRVIFPGFYRLVMRRSAAVAFKHADLLRAVSNSTREQLKRWASDKLVFQFATWTDIDSFIQVDPERRRQSQNLFFAGVLIPRKGVHHLVSAFAQVAPDFPDARLIITGREENKTYTAQLKTQIIDASLDGRVEFVGEVSQAMLAAGMQQANVFVFPSYSEGLPRVVFEAMAAGLPVIASAVSGIPDVVQDNVTGILVSPGDEVALAERIRWALEHPEAAREMGLHGRIFAERFFSTAAYVENYRQILDATKLLRAEQTKHAPSTL